MQIADAICILHDQGLLIHVALPHKMAQFRQLRQESPFGTQYACPLLVKVVLPLDGDRIAPVLDAARSFLLVTASSDGSRVRKEVLIADADPITKARRVAGLGARVLVCGAISWPLEAMLTSAGMRVILNTCGPVDEVIAAFFSGDLTEQAFLMPGCPGRQHRHRHRHGRRWRNERQ